MTTKNTFQLLHISDLHIKDSEEDKFDRGVVLDPLIERVKEDCERGLRPEIIAVTGDVAFQGIESEYKLAKKFFDDLLRAMELPDKRLFIVPGNHDVYRKKYPKSVGMPVYKTMSELNKEIEDKDDRSFLLGGMEDYFTFIEDNYAHLESMHDRLIPFVYVHEASCGKSIGLVGLNSAWMCRKSPDEREIAIGEFQVKTAMEELEKKGKVDLQICLFHHPLNWLWPEDRDISRSYLNGTVVLSGHLHDSVGGYFHDQDGEIHQFMAGGAYIGSDSDCPCRYQYITFDWDKGKLRVDYRKFVKQRRIWCVESDKGKDGKAVFDMPGTVTPEPPGTTSGDEDEVFKPYLQAALNEHRHLPTQGFETTLRVPIELERVYINMHAKLHAREFELNLDGKKRMQEETGLQDLSALDIKGAFEAADRFNTKDMVILGDPGSGKTTLLKYILVMLVKGEGGEKLGIGPNIIPFFAPLRELKDPETEGFLDFIKRCCCLKDHSVPDDYLESALANGQGIMLLDGLDEVASEDKRIKTCKWIERARKILPYTRFVMTSRYGGYLGRSRLEGNLLELSILDFTLEEAREFLIRWFEAVEVALHPEGDENKLREKEGDEALVLVETIEKAEHLVKLAVNPLLLQIIALVHRDRGRLPQRRVELYEECTNVLLEKWDMAKGLNVLLTAREARNILQPLALWLHEVDERRSAPLDEISKVIEDPLEDIGKQDVNSKALLTNIRDRSGIFMGYSGTDYGFTHLSFQEYLAAEQIRNKRAIDTLISNYGNRWWKEVILLCLALDNPSVIEEFMEKLIPTDKFKKEISLAADALADAVSKPSRPFITALHNTELASETRSNVIRLLKGIGSKKVVQALKEVVTDKDLKIARSAFEALEFLGAAEGVIKPAEEIPDRLKTAIDDSEMVLVPAGSFLYGSREDDREAHNDEKPQRVIDLPAFYMDVFPVTNRQYCEFLNQKRPDNDTLAKWIDLTGSFSGEKCRITKGLNGYIVEKGRERHPVIYISWHGAEAYAMWAGKRLPSEEEWEKAARGTEGAKYPWGNEFDGFLCNTRESGIGRTSQVDKFPEGRSPFGCFDMAGNVWEWTDSLYDEVKVNKVLRGGSWIFNWCYARCALRSGDFPGFGDGYIGFRCARTLK